MRDRLRALPSAMPRRMGSLMLLLGAVLALGPTRAAAAQEAAAAPPESASAPASAPEAAPEAAASAPADPPRAAPYQLEVVAPEPLDVLLRTYLDLARYRTDPELADVTDAEIQRLIAATPAQARALLETEGYFNATVTVERLPITPMRIRVQVDPGVRARINRVTLEVQGDIQDRADAGSARDQALLGEIDRGWRLRAGRGFRQSTWTAEKSEVLGRLRADGYPGASWAGTAAEVFAVRNEVRLFAVADSGPLYRFGPMQVEGLKLHRREAVSHLSTFEPGERYTEKQVLDFQERLQKSGLFESASVVLDPDPEQAEAAPVRVTVREAPLQDLTLGVGYSDVTRERATVEHLHRKVLGYHWQSKTKMELGRDQRTVSLELTSHMKRNQYRNLVAYQGERFTSDDSASTTSHRLRVGRTRDTERIERLYFGEYVSARVSTDLGATRASALTANYHWVLREVDSILLPTKGYTASAQIAAGHANSPQGNGPLARLYGRLTWYQPLGNAWYASARVEMGNVITRGEVGVPDTLLFRAGGDESVRGYAYRSIGPDLGGTVVGGKILGTASVELARPFSRRMRDWWWAVFVDGGDASNSWKTLSPKMGYGAGVRWRSPVGPLRIDLAYGEELQRLRLHLSVGVAF